MLRPALKARAEDDRACTAPLPFSSSSTLLESPHVHFPPTPILTSTALTHSPNVYDRAPIRVSPNACAIPERGDRTYSSDDVSPPTSISPIESYFQPKRPETMHSLQAWAADGRQSVLLQASHERYDMTPSPALVADISSESEDSDQCVSPNPPASPKIPMVSVQGPSGSTPYPFGGGFAREQRDYPFPGDDDNQLAAGLMALPFSLAHRVKKQHSMNLEGCPKKKIKKDRVPSSERTRKLSSSGCYSAVASSCEFAAGGCLDGF